MRRPASAPRGQVLVIVALGIIVLLAIAGIAIDVGRLMAERRHMQTAADAAALAACQSLKDGAVAVSMDDEIVRDTLVTRDGDVVSPALRERLGLAAAPAR